MIVSSYGSLTSLSPAPSPWPTSTSVNYYNSYAYSYATIYRTQPNVRTVVEFLGRNIAQLGIPVFRRVSDTDRERLSDHGLAVALRYPNPGTTRYRLIDSTIQDFAIYWNAFWLKVRVPNRLGLVRLPASTVTVEGGLLPSGYTWTTPDGQEKEFAPSEIVHFRGYDPLNPLAGLSPLETLRRILAEESSLIDYKENFWRTGSHLGGVISRPVNAPRWAPTQRDEFREHMKTWPTGGTPVLEDGMTFKEATASSKDSEGLATRKLTREEVARAFHIPLPMVGILDHATFSNVKEQHKHLYQDCLGPWCAMLEDEIELQLLPEFSDRDRVYIEFNIHEKLKGSFDEETESLQKAAGGPFMTVNECRARRNLPRDQNPKSDEIRTVANVEGKQPAAGGDDPAPAPAKPTPDKSEDDDEESDE